MLEKKQTKKIEEILTEIDLQQPAPAEEPMPATNSVAPG